jgi:hypothetical protein
MSTPHTKTDVIEQLREVEAALADTVNNYPAEQFDRDLPDSWSAASYLKHLILSNKPFAKALTLPKDQLQSMFGQPTQPSRSYDELVAFYNAKLAEGVRAENYNSVTPVSYRMPEGTDDVKAYLLETWRDTHNRLWQALENWQEEDLDSYQLPHPALGLLTLREMLFFTVHHNTLHWHDIQQTQVA